MNITVSKTKKSIPPKDIFEVNFFLMKKLEKITWTNQKAPNFPRS